MESKKLDPKFIESIEIPNFLDLKVECEDGYVPVTHLNKTIEYTVYEIELENGLKLKCADRHILIDENYNEVFAIDSLGTSIRTKFGVSKVVSITNLGYDENMFDLSVDSDEHTYYTDDILSHNTTLSAAVLLHYVLFNPDYTIAIVAHKAGGAREVLDRIQKMYELLPFWMMQGVTVWNKGDIKLENGSRVITGATTASGLRGKSCVTGDTKICVLFDDNIYYTEIDEIINKSEFINIEKTMFKYTVYKTTNKIDGKIYVGFHQVPKDSIILETNEMGSIYKDGYLGSGKYLIHAIEKYGAENFKQELLGIFDDIDSALNMEKNIVNKEFTLRDDTYNICEGGMVRIMYGKNNPFYGKKHDKETIEKIRKTREESGKPTYQSKIINNITKEIYLGVSDAVDKLKLDLNKDRLLLLDQLCYEGVITFFREENQRCSIARYEKFLEIERNKPLRKEQQAIICRNRFKGKKHSDDTKKKRADKVKKWINENPEKHNERMLKINKNPDKIRKTAETHRGMKRSDEACRNIKNACQGRVSNIKGMVSAYNIETNEIKFFDNIEDIPEGYKRGMPKRKNRGKLFNNGIDQKFFKHEHDVPKEWVLGGLPKPRKNR